MGMGKTTISASGGMGPLFQLRTTGTPPTHPELTKSFQCQKRSSTRTPDGRQLVGLTASPRDLRACLRDFVVDGTGLDDHAVGCAQ